MNLHKFNEDYFEDGVRKGVSGYEEYKWMPTRSIPEALDIKNNFNFDSCLDYGCAKGFLVHALRILGYNAWGEDISQYALKNCIDRVKPYLSHPTNKKYDLIIAKDILEHITEQNLPPLLKSLHARGNEFFFVIPLGDKDRFRIREYEVDITHVTKKDEEWWIDLFDSQGYYLKDFSYSFGSIKEKWLPVDKYGNGFFRLSKK